MLGSGHSSGMVNEASNLKANQNLTSAIDTMGSKKYQQQRDLDDIIPTHRRMTKDEEVEQRRLRANRDLAAYNPEEEKRQGKIERGGGDKYSDDNISGDDSDDELLELRRQRMIGMRRQADLEAVWRGKQHGEFREIAQDDFFNVVVREKGGSDQVAVHFYHKDFEHCKVMDRRLSELSREALSVRFVKIDAEKALFLVERLKVMMLPCLLLFKNDVCIDRILGFEGVQDEEGTLDPEMLKGRILFAMANGQLEEEAAGPGNNAIVQEAM